MTLQTLQGDSKQREGCFNTFLKGIGSELKKKLILVAGLPAFANLKL